MLRVVNAYISARIALRSFVRDARIVCRDADEHGAHVTRSLSAARKQQALHDPCNTNDDDGDIEEQQLHELETQLRELHALAVEASPNRENSLTLNTPPTTANPRGSSDEPRTLTLAAKLQRQPLGPGVVNQMGGAAKQSAGGKKCVADFTRDEVAVALLTKFQAA